MLALSHGDLQPQPSPCRLALPPWLSCTMGCSGLSCQPCLLRWGLLLSVIVWGCWSKWYREAASRTPQL